VSNARDAIRKRIERRVQKIKDTKSRNSTQNPKSICLNTLKELSDELPQATDAADFYNRLNFYLSKLQQKLYGIDPKCEIVLLWNESNDDVDWQNLHIKGIQVNWSIVYMAHHMKEDRSFTVDLSNLWLEDI
jgi:hypothetical protein